MPSETIPNSEIPTVVLTANSAEVLACSASISDSESSNMAETITNTKTIEIASDGAQSKIETKTKSSHMEASSSESVPEMSSEIIPEATSEEARETRCENVAETCSAIIPETSSETLLEITSETVSESVSVDTPDRNILDLRVLADDPYSPLEYDNNGFLNTDEKQIDAPTDTIVIKGVGEPLFQIEFPENRTINSHLEYAPKTSKPRIANHPTENADFIDDKSTEHDEPNDCPDTKHNKFTGLETGTQTDDHDPDNHNQGNILLDSVYSEENMLASNVHLHTPMEDDINTLTSNGISTTTDTEEGGCSAAASKVRLGLF